MGTKYLEMSYQTILPPGELRDATVNAFRPLGGGVSYTNNGLVINDGKFGISFQSWVKLNATIVFQRIREDYVSIQVYLNWSWSSLMWWIIIVGILLGGIPLILLVPYWLFDPAAAYQQALLRVQNIILGYVTLRMN